MGSVGCLAKGDIFFWQNILKNRSKCTGDISEQSVVCTVLISAIIIEIFRKNIPISYIIPYKNLASPLIPVCCMSQKVPRVHEIILGVDNCGKPCIGFCMSACSLYSSIFMVQFYIHEYP